MPYIPIIAHYHPFYIQSDTDALALDTAANWGMVAMTNPYSILPKAKTPYKTSWLDEDGDDEYAGELYFEAQEISVKFYVKTYDTGGVSAQEVMNTQLRNFFAKIKSGQFRIYDSDSRIGRQKVRYVDYAEEGKRIEGDGWVVARFTVRFKVNDPVTMMVMSNGSIVDPDLGYYVVEQTRVFTTAGDGYVVRGLR